MIDFEFKLDMKPLKALGPAVGFAMGAFMQKEGEELLAESREEVPIETAATWLSGYVQPSGRFTDVLHIEVGYTTEYAIWPHEMLEYKHPTGKAKFLEDPFNRRKEGFEGRAGAHLTRFIGRQR